MPHTSERHELDRPLYIDGKERELFYKNYTREMVEFLVDMANHDSLFAFINMLNQMREGAKNRCCDPDVDEAGRHQMIGVMRALGAIQDELAAFEGKTKKDVIRERYEKETAEDGERTTGVSESDTRFR